MSAISVLHSTPRGLLVVSRSLAFSAPHRLPTPATAQQRRIFSATTRQQQAKGSPSKRWLSSPSTTDATTNSSSSLKKKLLGEEALIPCRSILPLSLVNHPTVKIAVPVIGNLAYIVIASGFLMTDMLQLRVLLAGGYTGLVTYHILRPVPLRIPLRWSAVFIMVNAGAAMSLLADRYMAPLTEEEEVLYNKHFTVLTRGQFYQLLSQSQRIELDDKTILTVEGTPCPNLYFIEQGQAQVYHHKDHAANIESGGFVNDVAFQQGENVGAYGTVVASGKCSALVWDTAKLRKHLSSRPDMDRNLKYILSNHLVKSLLRQREAAHLRQRRLRKHNKTTGEPPSPNGTISRSLSHYHVSW